MPWEPLLSIEGLAQKLFPEIGPRHPLHGSMVRQVAKRLDCDDVLVEVVGSERRLAVVHRTYGLVPDPDSRFPWVTWYADFEAWAANGMRGDHSEFTSDGDDPDAGDRFDGSAR